jgi:predicted PurR-regulated permease PerM
MQAKYPFYLKTTVILFGLTLFVYALYNLREILVPLCFALMLGILLNPVTNKFREWKLPRVMAITVSLLLALLLIAGMVYFLSSQMARFSDQLPQLKKKALELVSNFQHELKTRFGVNTAKQDQVINEAESGIKPWIGSALGTIAGSMAMAFLLPVYTFLFLFYKPLLLNFLYEVFAEENSAEVGVVLIQTKTAVQRYMFGLVLEGLIVALLNSAALFVLGVDYAILLGVLGAVLNVLPFVGGILAVALPLIIATITKDGFHTQLGIIISYIIIQFVDNHFLVPYIVSSKVKINALISIVIVLMGGALWGIAGMFLSIPFTGVLKIIFDRIPELKPWGKLLGSEVPVRHKGQIWNSVKTIPRRTSGTGKKSK